jgi:hypothetical protein
MKGTQQAPKLWLRGSNSDVAKQHRRCLGGTKSQGLVGSVVSHISNRIHKFFA